MFDVIANLIYFIRRAGVELWDRRRLVFFIFLLSISLFAPYVLINAEDGRNVHKVALFLASGCILLTFVNKISLFIISLPVVLANLFHLHIYRVWGGTQLRSRVEAAYESPPSEMIEYLQSHLDYVDFGLLIVSVIYLALVFHVVFRMREIPTSLKKLATVALIAWVSIFIGYDGNQRIQSFPPFQLVMDTVRANQQYKALKARNDFLAQNPLQLEECGSKYTKIVIVLGESVISDHMSLFGYAKPTTPFIDSSGPYAFNALSPSNQTRYSLLMMFTNSVPGNLGPFWKEHSLVGQLRHCGFETTWISNQGRIGEQDSLVSSLALEADEQIFLNQLSWKEAQDDGTIVDILADQNVYRRQDHATFIHLIGSHTKYAERYPTDFGFENISDKVAAYDNSLLYSDFVLSQLYKNFYDDNLLFIFVSDHGQVVSNEEHGSGFDPAYKEEYRIPLLVWTKDSASMDKIYEEIGGRTLNTSSFQNIVRFLVGASSLPAISTSKNVSTLLPEYVKDYDELKSFHDD